MPSTNTSAAFPKGLYLILTEPCAGYEDMTKWAVRARLPAIQLRFKQSDEDRFFYLAKTMRRLTEKSDIRFIVNDRPDIARAVQADGVHVGQEDIPVAKVRRLVGARMLVGLSTHNLEQVRRANALPIDYIGFGPLYATSSKVNPDPVIGPRMLLRASQISRHPIVAIGGLDLDRIKILPPSACRNAAIISAVSQATDPFSLMQNINRYLQDR